MKRGMRSRPGIARGVELVRHAGPRWALAGGGLVLLWIGRELVTDWSVLLGHLGGDYRLYMAAGQRWLAGGMFYPAWQVHGPYVLELPAVLYPPYTVPFFAAASLLPWPVWYLPPLLITAWAIGRLRPGPWTTLALLVLAADPHAWYLVAEGNPAIWVTAALALAAVGYGTGVLALVKPSLFPLALAGVWRTSWWRTAVVLGVLAIVTLPLWPDYVAVLLDARGPKASLLYSVKDLSLVCLPLVAWLGTRRLTRDRSGAGRDASPSSFRRWTIPSTAAREWGLVARRVDEP